MADYDEYMKRPLEVAYVDGILEKLILTIEKYELVIPEIDDMVQEIVKKKPKDQFSVVIIVLEALTKYKTTSPFIEEIFNNVKKDFWHGVNEDLPRHEGEFYINSVAD